MSSVLQSIFII